jgi:hypothetical protein
MCCENAAKEEKRFRLREQLNLSLRMQLLAPRLRDPLLVTLIFFFPHVTP